MIQYYSTIKYNKYTDLVKSYTNYKILLNYVNNMNASYDIEIDNENDVPYVHIEPINCPFSDEQLDYFTEHCKPLTMEDDRNNLQDRFMCALAFANEIINDYDFWEYIDDDLLDFDDD